MQPPDTDTDGWDADPEMPDNLPVSDPRSRTEESSGRLVRRVWRPDPVDHPEVDADLPKLPWPERCAEAIRYAFLSAEHWLSPKGVLREWLRVSLWIGVSLLAAALLVVPPVTLLLEGAVEWTGLVSATASNIVATVTGLPPVVIALGSLFIGYRLLRRHLARRRQQRGYREDPYDM